MNNNKIFINLFSLLIAIVDYRNKKKIINFFKKKFNNQLLDIIDIGAHKGESIERFKTLFSKTGKWLYLIAVYIICKYST